MLPLIVFGIPKAICSFLLIYHLFDFLHHLMIVPIQQFFRGTHPPKKYDTTIFVTHEKPRHKYPCKKIRNFCSPVSLIVLFVDLIQLHMFRVYEVSLDLFLLHFVKVLLIIYNKSNLLPAANLVSDSSFFIVRL